MHSSGTAVTHIPTSDSHAMTVDALTKRILLRSIMLESLAAPLLQDSSSVLLTSKKIVVAPQCSFSAAIANGIDSSSMLSQLLVSRCKLELISRLGFHHLVPLLPFEGDCAGSRGSTDGYMVIAAV